MTDVQTSTLAANPEPPETQGAQSGGAVPSNGEQPKRRKKARRKRNKTAQDAAPAAVAPNDEQMADIGRATTLAARYGLTLEDYIEDLRAMVTAYDAMHTYAEAHKAK